MQMDASPADQQPPGRRRRCCDGVTWGYRALVVFSLLCAVFLIVALGYFVTVTVSGGHPVFSASIDAVSGLELDPAKDPAGQAPTLDPEFSLTIRVSSRRRMSMYPDCLPSTGAATTVEVTYRGVLLASGPVGQLCVGVGETKDEAAVAWGTGVRLPGFLLDALAADARRGAAAFDGVHHDHYYQETRVSCTARRVGDEPVAALNTPCLVSTADVPVSYPNTGRTQPAG
uniref:Late embryogenesis abundant protein LEA-2 subgroup domain-containing protein n=1 Tax=Oryza brachyantha TaxID=4533 RepID=J3LEU9_ORYBR